MNEQETPLSVAHANKVLSGSIPLVASKSESNRALIIQALGGSGIVLKNLSAARDTQTMQRLLQEDTEVWDVLDAGTTMRFLTAFAAVSGKAKTMTGTARMCQRPIGILIEALKVLGAKIEYQQQEGFPPFNIEGEFHQKTNKISIRGDVSSQYISALLMVGPSLPLGLTLELVPPVHSRPYIEMTLELMRHFGALHSWDAHSIQIPHQDYQAGSYVIESDWSGASYWFSMVALAKSAELKLMNLRKNSLQGDKAIVEIMDQLGVASSFEENGLILTKKQPAEKLEYDFSHCPDLAQTIAVVCAALQVRATMTGLQSLRIKETDRIEAIKTELEKIGGKVNVIGDEQIDIVPSPLSWPDDHVVNTYDDHRMAMAFAPLALLKPIGIESPSVVNKSYPSFWEDMKQVGFSTSEV